MEGHGPPWPLVIWVTRRPGRELGRCKSALQGNDQDCDKDCDHDLGGVVVQTEFLPILIAIMIAIVWACRGRNQTIDCLFREL